MREKTFKEKDSFSNLKVDLIKRTEDRILLFEKERKRENFSFAFNLLIAAFGLVAISYYLIKNMG